MARIEITIEGRTKRGQKAGKVTRTLASARSKRFLLDNIDQIKSSIKVGMGGRHEIMLNDGERTLKRVDEARCGFREATIGSFKFIS